MTVFSTRILPEAGLTLLKEAGIAITQWQEKRELTQEELIENCKQHDALISAGRNKLDKVFLNACRHLKVISLLSVGYDNIDIAEAKRLQIRVGNTPGVLSAATAETAFLLMIAASRKAFYLHKKIQQGAWDFYDPTADLGIDLQGATLGIFGLGKIGIEMAKRCIGAFNMKVIYHNRNRNVKAEKKLDAVYVSFDELLAQSDVLSVHTALTEETKNKFNKGAFSKMKSNAIFVNTARGAIHNEADLTEAIQQQIIWGAGLDVTNPEPMHKDNLLLQMPTVAVLPHIGSATKQTRDAMAVLTAQNVIAAFKNEKLPNEVVE